MDVYPSELLPNMNTSIKIKPRITLKINPKKNSISPNGNLIPNGSPKTKTNVAKIFPICDYILHFDGCSKGNPGPAGIGAVLYNRGEEIWGGSKYIGRKTNNQSEYTALLFGLQTAIDYNIKELIVYGDSQLVINQINKIYKIKNTDLMLLYEEAQNLIKQFTYIEFVHVYRDKNKRADELSNIALLDCNIQHIN